MTKVTAKNSSFLGAENDTGNDTGNEPEMRREKKLFISLKN